jgi:Mycothiol maleylpyruvate isomerase N-terminal domain/SCP-2 sterol transfer family
VDLPLVPRQTLGEMRAGLEGMWSAFDAIYGSFGPAEWARKYGKDWTFADQPFHMAYFDREVVNIPLEAGEAMPQSERWSFGSPNGINAWNAREFAKRPAGETPERSVDRMHEEHDRLRGNLDGLNDADLDIQLAWAPPFGQMGTLREAVVGAVVHNWGELSELRFRAKRRDVPVPASSTKLASAFYANFLTFLAKPERAAAPFGVTIDLVGPGGGTYGIRLAEGSVVAHVGAEPSADVTIRTTPDDFNIVMIRQAVNPLLAMLTGTMKVKGFTKMARMRTLFPEPRPNDPFAFPG